MHSVNQNLQPESSGLSEPRGDGHFFLKDASTLAEFVQAFEECTLASQHWTHSAHVAVASVYVAVSDTNIAIDKMREGVKKFNVCSGGRNTETSGYHETLTIFWVHLIAELRAQRPEETPLEFATTAVKRFGKRSKLHAEYYSFDVVGSREARFGWIAPDRAPAQ